MSPVIYDYKKNQEKLGIANSNATSTSANTNNTQKEANSLNEPQYRQSMSLTYNSKIKNQLNYMLSPDNTDQDMPNDNLFDLNPEKTTK